MMIQEQLFDMPEPAKSPPEPPVPPTPAQAELLGPCVKCGKEATRRSPSGQYVYCYECGRCGGKVVRETALGISVEICGGSVEEFVWHTRMQRWVCSCMPQF